MDSIPSLARQFLSLPVVAVIGISASKQTVANAVCRKLRTGSRIVYAVGRSTKTFDGIPCYPDLASLPEHVHGVFIAVKSERTDVIVDQCIALKIPHVWMHHAGGTDFSAASSATVISIQKCRENNIAVIPGACPMMFCDDADLGHRCMKWFLSVTGKLK